MAKRQKKMSLPSIVKTAWKRAKKMLGSSQASPRKKPAPTPVATKPSKPAKPRRRKGKSALKLKNR